MFQIIRMSACFSILFVLHSSRGTPLTGKVRHAKKGEFPFVVSISWKNPINILSKEKNHFCGGTLITAKHVLTAAHCFTEHKDPDEIVVKVNNRDIVESSKYKVRKLTTFDEWAKNEVINKTLNDIAIVELKTCVSSKIKPAVITNKSEAELYGKQAVTAGWGLIENEARPRYLLTGEVNVLKTEDCLRNSHDDVKSQINSTTHIFMCSSAQQKISLEPGDSGSPLLLAPNEIIAVNKGNCFRTKGKVTCERQNLHLSVIHYREFITDMIKDKVLGCCIS